MVAYPANSHQILQPVLLQLLHCILSGQEVKFNVASWFMSSHFVHDYYFVDGPRIAAKNTNLAHRLL